MVTFVICAWMGIAGEMANVSTFMQWWLFALMVFEATAEIGLFVKFEQWRMGL